jgi:hypothetical protein
VIPQHDLTATLTERDGGATIEVTLTWHPAVGEPEDIGYEPEYWGFFGETFHPFGSPEGSLEDSINLYCLEGSPSIGMDYDGTVGQTFDVTFGPYHSELAGDDINLFARYSSIVVDDPEA